MVSVKNRGKPFERRIEGTNRQYYHDGIAVIHKNPTPWVVQYDNKRGKVRNAWPDKKGNVDFSGAAQGRAVAFEAKSTSERTRFPLSMIEPHQYEILERHEHVGGVSFVLVEFAKHDEVYLLPFAALRDYWEAAQEGGRKSIPYWAFVSEYQQVKPYKHYGLHYLKHILEGL